MVEAGSSIAPAFVSNNVSPRVSDTIIAPQLPLRTLEFRNTETSEASASADVGMVCRSVGHATR